MNLLMSLFYRQSYLKRVTLRLCLANPNLFRSNAFRSQVIVYTPRRRRHSAKECPRWRFPSLSYVRRNWKFRRPASLASYGALSRATIKRRLLEHRAARASRGEIRSAGTLLLLQHVRYLHNPSRPYRPTPPRFDNGALSFTVLTECAINTNCALLRVISYRTRLNKAMTKMI